MYCMGVESSKLCYDTDGLSVTNRGIIYYVSWHSLQDSVALLFLGIKGLPSDTAYETLRATHIAFLLTTLVFPWDKQPYSCSASML